MKKMSRKRRWTEKKCAKRSEMSRWNKIIKKVTKN